MHSVSCALKAITANFAATGAVARCKLPGLSAFFATYYQLLLSSLGYRLPSDLVRNGTFYQKSLSFIDQFNRPAGQLWPTTHGSQVNASVFCQRHDAILASFSTDSPSKRAKVTILRAIKREHTALKRFQQHSLVPESRFWPKPGWCADPWASGIREGMSAAPAAYPAGDRASWDHHAGDCKDDLRFKGPKGISCEGWSPDSCYTYDGYTTDELAAIRDRCPRSCGICARGVSHHAQDSIPYMPRAGISAARRMATWAHLKKLYNDFDIILDHFPRVFQLHPTPHAL